MVRRFIKLSLAFALTSCVSDTPSAITYLASRDSPPKGSQAILTDCDIPFDQLRTRSESCLVRSGAASRRQCEQFVPSEFTEVVALSLWPAGAQGGSPEECTGTLVAQDWVLTAAHCFAHFSSKLEVEHDPPVRVIQPKKDWVQVRAHAAVLLSEDEKENWAEEVYMHHQYISSMGQKGFSNDLALLHLAKPFPSDRVESAMLAQIPIEDTTSAGYGLTDATDNDSWGITVTWPSTLVTKSDQSYFKPLPRRGLVSGFCAGDSGGPIFSGRNRGCPSSGRIPERRPRLLQGVISYEHSKLPYGASASEIVTSCQMADSMFVQNTTYRPLRNWICKVTNNKAKGCY